MTRAAELHRHAMETADRAFLEMMGGRAETAQGLYRKAFELERDASSEALRLHLGEPTISVLHRSAATLALDAGEVREAERLIATALSLDPPDPIADELRDLLEQVYFHRHLSLRGVELNPSEFQFALIGSAVGFGMVASNEFVNRVRDVEALIYRTAERKLRKPFREAGRRKKSLQDEIDLYVSVPRAASFAVTFRIGSSVQLSLLPEMAGLGQQLVDELLTCFELLDRGDNQSIRQRIPEPDYFRNFMNLAAQIAPDGKQITGIGFTTTQASGALREVALRRPRKALRLDDPDAPAIAARPVPVGPTQDVTVVGRLEWASSLRQENEIRIQTEEGAVDRVSVPPGLMNDIVRPLWDEKVVITGRRRTDGVIVLVTIHPAD